MKKINLFNKTMFPLSDGKGCPVERGGVWELPRRTPCATPSWKEGEHKVPSYRGTGPRKNVPSFRGNAESPRCCRELVCGKTDGIPLFSGMTVRICGMMIAIAALFATPSFAEPTELDKKTVASKAYVDTKQDIIETGLVEFDDLGTTAAVPALVLTNAAGTALNGNTIGFLDLNTYNNLNSGFDELPDTMVPSIGLLNTVFEDIWNSMPYWNALPWSVYINNTPDNGANRTNAINAYNTTFGNGTNNWAGDSSHLIDGQFLANSLALKQNKITTGLVEFEDTETEAVCEFPSLVSYDTTSGLIGNKIGVYNYETCGPLIDDLQTFVDLGANSSAYLDNYVPTLRAVAKAFEHTWENIYEVVGWNPLTWNNTQSTAINAYNSTFGNGTNQWAGSRTHLINGQFLANSLALKQNKLPAKSTGNTAPKGNQAIVLDAAGYPSNVYTTAGKDLALTAKSGAQKVMNYIDGTTASATFATSQGFTEAQVKSALVSLELLKDVYDVLNTKITNNALPTGTTGTVVTYNGTNATTGVQQFTETAISGTATYDDNDQLTNGNNIANVSLVETEIATRQKKRTCAGYETGHENDPDYCWLWNFPD